MGAKTFTYIIRSSSKTSDIESTNSCRIRLDCPSTFKQYDVEVISFILSYGTDANTVQEYCELAVENMQILDGSDTKHKRLSTLCFHSFTSSSTEGLAKFRVDNFNGKEILFKLLNEENNPLVDDGDDYDQPWVLVLRLTGVDER